MTRVWRSSLPGTGTPSLLRTTKPKCVIDSAEFDAHRGVDSSFPFDALPLGPCRRSSDRPWRKPARLLSHMKQQRSLLSPPIRNHLGQITARWPSYRVCTRNRSNWDHTVMTIPHGGDGCAWLEWGNGIAGPRASIRQLLMTPGLSLMQRIGGR